MLSTALRQMPPPLLLPLYWPLFHSRPLRDHQVCACIGMMFNFVQLRRGSSMLLWLMLCPCVQVPRGSVWVRVHEWTPSASLPVSSAAVTQQGENTHASVDLVVPVTLAASRPSVVSAC